MTMKHWVIWLHRFSAAFLILCEHVSICTVSFVLVVWGLAHILHCRDHQIASCVMHNHIWKLLEHQLYNINS